MVLQLYGAPTVHAKLVAISLHITPLSPTRGRYTRASALKSLMLESMCCHSTVVLAIVTIFFTTKGQLANCALWSSIANGKKQSRFTNMGETCPTLT